MAHELCHIVEVLAEDITALCFIRYGDSKWAEILQYDIFTALGSPRAASWHRDYGRQQPEAEQIIRIKIENLIGTGISYILPIICMVKPKCSKILEITGAALPAEERKLPGQFY